MQNTIFNMSLWTTPSLTVAKMANTIEEAPRSPTNDTSAFCFIINFLKGINIRYTEHGLANKRIKKNMSTAGRRPGYGTEAPS